jgi:hypothetical protein
MTTPPVMHIAGTAVMQVAKCLSRSFAFFSYQRKLVNLGFVLYAELKLLFEFSIILTYCACYFYLKGSFFQYSGSSLLHLDNVSLTAIFLDIDISLSCLIEQIIIMFNDILLNSGHLAADYDHVMYM